MQLSQLAGIAAGIIAVPALMAVGVEDGVSSRADSVSADAPTRLSTGLSDPLPSGAHYTQHKVGLKIVDSAKVREMYPNYEPGSGQSTALSDDVQKQALFGCSPIGRAHNPHISSSAFNASGHADWRKNDCSNNTATLLVQLQQLATNGNVSWWVTRAENIDDVAADDVGGGDVVAQKACDASIRTGWRVVVDVDVNGEVDDGGQDTNINNLYCRDY